MADGLVIDHWANRDDLGLAGQVRWIPTHPAYLLRRRAARRAMRDGGELTDGGRPCGEQPVRAP
jgi:hypothetical protein